jgi:hypothetical protein
MFKQKTVLAFAVLIGASGVALADTSYFQQGEKLQAGDQIDVGMVRSEQGGTLEIYSFHCGSKGELLGTEDLLPGVNSDVRVDVGIGVPGEILAVINKDGQEMAYKIFTVE